MIILDLEFNKLAKNLVKYQLAYNKTLEFDYIALAANTKAKLWSELGLLPNIEDNWNFDETNNTLVITKYVKHHD